MKRTASAATLAATLALAPLTVAGTATAAPYYPNCDAAHAAGVSNIHVGEPGYRPALDKDHDGVACEEHEGSGSGGHGSSVSHPSTGSDEGSGTPNDSSTSPSGTSSSSSAAQVAVVPQGGAETGDGSTEGHPGWWVGGVLLAGLAALAGLATARRARVTSGRTSAPSA